MINLNKDDFHTAEDINEAVGPILNELFEDKKTDELVDDLCVKFFHILER